MTFDGNMFPLIVCAFEKFQMTSENFCVVINFEKAMAEPTI